MKRLFLVLQLLTTTIPSFASDANCMLKVKYSVFAYEHNVKRIHQTDLIDTKFYEHENSLDCFVSALVLASSYYDIYYGNGSRYFGLQKFNDIPLYVWIEWRHGNYFRGDKGKVTKHTIDYYTGSYVGDWRYFEDGSFWSRSR